jgi:hypothetical protein
MTLGALAIEQLTGTIVAKQVLLTGETNASASANIANTQAQLERAQKIELEKKATLDSAKDAQKKQQDLVDQTQKSLDDELAKPADKQDKDLIKKSQEELPAQSTELTKKKDAVKAAQADFDIAHRATDAILQNLNAAITTAAATAKTSGSFSADANQKAIDKDTVAVIADATKSIVVEIVRKGHATDTCLNFMTAYANLKDPQKERSMAPINEHCKQIMAAYLKAYADSNARGSTTPPPPAPAPPPPSNK